LSTGGQFGYSCVGELPSVEGDFVVLVWQAPESVMAVITAMINKIRRVMAVAAVPR